MSAPKEPGAADLARLLNELLPLTNAQQHPNINNLWRLLKDVEAMRLNIKTFGYELARRLEPGFERIDLSDQPRTVGLVSKPTTQSDVESPWFSFWCRQLGAAPVYHRKLWEFAFALQALHDAGLLRPGVRGIGFGCGREPLASYFAARGMRVTVTDLDPERVRGRGWAEAGQHTGAADHAFYPDLVERAEFDRLVQHAFIDMNDIPPSFDEQYDFCWSICALEHLGSIEQGLRFIENSLMTLRPGGIAVHTTEYNYLSETRTIDDWPTVLYLKRHFVELADRLARAGHRLLGPDFDVGSGVLDQFIDLPPYQHGAGQLGKPGWRDRHGGAHLKLSVDGFPCTCFGLIVRKYG